MQIKHKWKVTFHIDYTNKCNDTKNVSVINMIELHTQVKSVTIIWISPQKQPLSK